MRQERVVELFFGTRSRGSGYLITPRQVLTARHVVNGAQCLVQPLLAAVGAGRAVDDQRPAAVPGRLGWQPAEATLDLAIVTLDAPLELPGIDAATALARIPRGEAWSLDYHGIGFPRGNGIFSRPLRGSFSEVPDAGRLDLELDMATLRDVNQWVGLSGTVVFHGRMAVGVVAEVDPKWAGGKLDATPLHRLLSAPGFADWWRAQGLPPLTLAELGRQHEAAASWVTGRVHRMDREDSLTEVRGLLKQAPSGAPAAPLVVLVEGREDDWHDKLMQRLAELPELCRALNRDTAPENLILQLPWPQQQRISDVDGALRVLLQPLLASTVGTAAEASALDALRAPVALAMDEMAPRAVWTLINRRIAYGGHGELAHALLAWWCALPLRQRAMLFLCVATDEAPAPKQSLFDKLRRNAPAAETTLVEGLMESLQTLGCAVEVLSPLDAVQARHVQPWIDSLGAERERLLAPGQWHYVADALRAGLAASDGERLALLVGRLRVLVHEALQQTPQR